MDIISFFWCHHVLLLSLVVCRGLSHESEKMCDFSKKIISAAMIADMYPHQTDILKQKYYDYDLTFTKEVFRSAHPPIQWFYAPPVYSKGCYDQTMAGFSPRGPNLAHKEAWDHFVRFHKSCGDVLIVFENDAVEGLPNNQAGKLAIDYAKNMTNDLLFLGSCYEKPELHYSISNKTPYCDHAYALTVHGAKKLLEHFDACGLLSDVQMAQLCNDKILDCSYTKETYDRAYVKKYLHDKGMTLSGYFLFDQIFVQVKIDPVFAQVERAIANGLKDGYICIHEYRGRSVYILINQTWRLVPDMNVFGRLNLEGVPLARLTDFQFNSFPEGLAVTYAEVEEKKLWELQNSTITTSTAVGHKSHKGRLLRGN